MSDMVEKAAKAAWMCLRGIDREREVGEDDEDWQEVLDARAEWPARTGFYINADGFRDCARAAIEAMIEPTEAMKDAGEQSLCSDPHCECRPGNIWQSDDRRRASDRSP